MIKTVWGLFGNKSIPTSMSGVLGTRSIHLNKKTSPYTIIAPDQNHCINAAKFFGSRISLWLKMYIQNIASTIIQILIVYFLIFFSMGMSLIRSCFLSKKDTIKIYETNFFSCTWWWCCSMTGSYRGYWTTWENRSFPNGNSWNKYWCCYWCILCCWIRIKRYEKNSTRSESSFFGWSGSQELTSQMS